MINLTTARLIWLLYTSDLRRELVPGWTPRGRGPGRALGRAGARHSPVPRHPARASFFPPLPACSHALLSRSWDTAPGTPSPFLSESRTRSSQAFSRASPPGSPPRPAAFSRLALPPQASLPPSLLLLCVPSLVLKEFVGVPPTPPPPVLLLKIWQENNQGATKSGESWAGVCAPSLGLSLSDGS